MAGRRWCSAASTPTTGPRFGAEAKPDAAPPAPIVAVAVDLPCDAELAESLRETVWHIMTTLPGARLACLNVLRQAPHHHRHHAGRGGAQQARAAAGGAAGLGRAARPCPRGR
jgi:hypothetical protein